MIAIKDMEEIPETCWDCPILCKENGQCERTKKYIYGMDIPTDCTLVKIITCKECANGHKYNNVEECYCDYLRTDVDTDFYCAEAKRRE